MEKNAVQTLEKCGAIYASDPQLTLTDLKKWKFQHDIDTSKVVAYAEKHAIYSVSQQDPHFPKRLKNLTSAPFLLYYQGDLSLLDQPLLWVIWPRNPSDYAGQVMQSFFLQAYKYQLATISGFARGIDQSAHHLSLKYQIPTIAVLWWGFQHYLRGKDRELLQSIIANGGLVISQFKIGFEPTKRSFPARNKLLALLCDMLFLPEAQEKSWSLITTEFAYQYQKPVYSVPAPLFSQQSAGIFSKMEEKKLTLTSDFSSCLKNHFLPKDSSTSGLSSAQVSASPAYFSSSQTAIFTLLKHWAKNMEQLLEKLDLNYSSLMQELTMLEMDWYICQSTPGVYTII